MLGKIQTWTASLLGCVQAMMRPPSAHPASFKYYTQLTETTRPQSITISLFLDKG